MTATATDEDTQLLEPVSDELDDALLSDGADTGEPESSEQPARPRRLRWLIAAVIAALIVAGAGIAVAVAHKSIAIDIDGEVTTTGTFANSVADVLDERGVVVAEHDLVVPGLDQPLVEGTDIVVRTAEQVTVMVDGAPTQLWTVGETAAAALSGFAVQGVDATFEASRNDGQLELGMPLIADGVVTFLVDGDTVSTQISGAVDLTGALMAAELEVAPSDQVTVSHSADGPVVTITRISNEVGTRTEAIPFETIERDTSDLYTGQSRVVTEGSEGVRTYTFVNRLVDGEVTSSRLQDVAVTTEPVDRIVENGTASRPVVTASSSSSGGTTVSGDVWSRLAQCESGGNPAIVSSNGLYHGLYQFSVATWQSVGGSGLPSQASAAEQTQRAQALQARSGWGQWPHCSSVLGLR